MPEVELVVVKFIPLYQPEVVVNVPATGCSKDLKFKGAES